ncbi:MAG TPA: VapC toxin family PIN domain ribonuclease [Rhizobiales bacterium]|nr:VapC toxin family PIN domain ribonuclease [Hyphomicrobiales bacterium]
MIVVDTNVVHYCWVHGQNTEVAQAVRRQDPDWHVPILWRSELRNVLTAYLRRGLMSRAQIVGILTIADKALAGSEHSVTDDLVLDVVTNSTLTAYDAEFVALASALSVPLVTADKAVLKAFPDCAVTMEAFVGR